MAKQRSLWEQFEDWAGIIFPIGMVIVIDLEKASL